MAAGTRVRRYRTWWAVAACAALLLAACAEDEGADGDGGGGGSDTTVAGGAEGMSEEDATEWALEYVGGTAGAASGEPYRIGFGHSSDFFPEGDAAAEAAVRFVNEELGGVGGRPIELVPCNLAAASDGAACGGRFANDEGIDLVIGGLILHGNGDFYGALAGEAAAIIATPLDVSDYTSPHGVSYNTGALGAGVGGAEFVNTELKPKTTALIVTDDVAGRGGASVLRPIVDEAGVEMKEVFVPPTATAPEIASAMQAAGAGEVDILTIGLFEQGCIAAYDALQSLGLEPTVVTTSVCLGKAMQDHLDELGEESAVPNGWYFVGANPYEEDPADGVAVYLTKMRQYGQGDLVATVGAPFVFDAVMNATKFVNQVGVEEASFETLDAAVRGFEGPDMLQSGPIECGNPPYVSICASEVSVYRYLDGEWISVRTASEGNPVDISDYLKPQG